jgi:hypothetical protein
LQGDRRAAAARPTDPCWHPRCTSRSPGGTMLDLVFVIVTVAFFATSIAYTSACERL